jgi:RNA polymerase sigma-70 factor (ECF subfamily)
MSRVTTEAVWPSLHADLGNRSERLEEDLVALFDQFREPLLRYLSTFGPPIHDNEEIVQEAFLSLFRHLQDGKSRANLRGWLFRVAHNLALKHRLRARRAQDARAEGDAQDLAVDPGPSPEDLVASHQVRRRLLKVVEALPQQDRRCLALRAEGLRYREIAAVLNVSLGAVSLSLTRSLARIARCAARLCL